jgi:methylenetetrahydrofolate dehydrogenase (NADP+)/methenyltetrahydrofolate cyclohydrolase
LNYDNDVVGIVAARPVESGEQQAWWSPRGPAELKRLHEAVHPLKDVEGMHPVSLGQVVYSHSTLWPCTARASLEMAALACNSDLRGLEALVIGSGDVVAKPLFSMLQARGATVTAAPADAPKLPLYTRSVDAVFSCVGSPSFELTGDMLRPGCLLIDVGLRQESPDSPVLKGDADLDSVMGVVSKIATIPRGIAKLRTAFLFLNVAEASERLSKGE